MAKWHGGDAVRHSVADGLELDDDRSRVDVDAVHDYLSNVSYWARGRPWS
jgi:hypothetical protein